MSFVPVRALVPDPNNSTTDVLAAGATFTGVGTEVLDYHQIHYTFWFEPNEVPNGDASTAQGSLFFEFSPDNTNWDVSVPVFVRSGINIPTTLVVVDRYFRVRYVNDGGAAAIAALGITDEVAGTPTLQTAFRFNTYLVSGGTKELTRTIDQSVSGSHPVNLVRAVVMGKGPAGMYLNTPVSDGGEFIQANYGTEVARGNLSGRTFIRKFGRNGAVPSGSEETLWAVSTAYNFLTAASSLRIAAGGNAADTALGTGARSVRIDGLDASGDVVSETLATNGILMSSGTAASFLRVNRVEVTGVGTYGVSNAGIITIETTTGTTVARVPAGAGRDQLAVYSVPNGKKGYIRRSRFQIEGTKSASCFMNLRENLTDTSAPMSPMMRLLQADDLDGSLDLEFDYPDEIPGLSDVWLTAQATSASAKVNGSMTLELVDD